MGPPWGQAQVPVPAAPETPAPTPAPAPADDTDNAVAPTDLPASNTGFTGGDNRTSWEYFEGYNCFPGKGGENIDGKSPIPGAMLSLQECREECEKEPTCQGIVQERSRSKYLCWLQKSVESPSCDKNTAYDYWKLEK